MTKIADATGGEVDLTRDTLDYVTFFIAGQLFGVPVTSINDVFTPRGLTPVPRAKKEIAGVLNLRGRIVTVIDARQSLDLPPADEKAVLMAIGIEQAGESYGILIDSVGEVLTLSGDKYERNPANLDSRWKEVSMGVYRLEKNLLVVLDISQLLKFEKAAAA